MALFNKIRCDVCQRDSRPVEERKTWREVTPPPHPPLKTPANSTNMREYYLAAECQTETSSQCSSLHCLRRCSSMLSGIINKAAAAVCAHTMEAMPDGIEFRLLVPSRSARVCVLYCSFNNAAATIRCAFCTLGHGSAAHVCAQTRGRVFARRPGHRVQRHCYKAPKPQNLKMTPG